MAATSAQVLPDRPRRIRRARARRRARGCACHGEHHEHHAHHFSHGGVHGSIARPSGETQVPAPVKFGGGGALATANVARVTAAQARAQVFGFTDAPASPITSRRRTGRQKRRRQHAGSTLLPRVTGARRRSRSQGTQQQQQQQQSARGHRRTQTTEEDDVAGLDAWDAAEGRGHNIGRQPRMRRTQWSHALSTTARPTGATHGLTGSQSTPRIVRPNLLRRAAGVVAAVSRVRSTSALRHGASSHAVVEGGDGDGAGGGVHSGVRVARDVRAPDGLGMQLQVALASDSERSLHGVLPDIGGVTPPSARVTHRDVPDTLLTGDTVVSTGSGERTFVYPPLRGHSDTGGSRATGGDADSGDGEEGERRRAHAARRRAMGRRLSTRRTDLLTQQVESHNSFLSAVARVSDPASGSATRARHADDHHTALFYRATGASSVNAPVRHPDAPFFFANAAQAAGGLVVPVRAPRWSDTDSMYGGSASVVSDGYGSTGSWSGGDSSVAATVAAVTAADGYLPTGNWYMGPHLKARARHRLAKHMLQRALAGVGPKSARGGAGTARSAASSVGGGGVLSARGTVSGQHGGHAQSSLARMSLAAGPRQARKSYPVDAASSGYGQYW